MTLGRQLALLRDPPSFGLLALATFASGLGTWLAFVALTVDVFDRTGSATWVSALLIADFLPSIVIGVTAASLVDRMPRRRLMVASDLVRVAVFAALIFADSPAQIVALAAVAGFATGFFRPAVYAGLPNLVRDEDLPGANSVIQTIENVTLAAGPIAGGLLVSITSPDLAYGINAVTFLVSALLIVRIPAHLLQAVAAVGRGYWRDLADGFALIRNSRALLTVLAAWNVVMLATAGENVAEVVLAKDAFSAGDFGYGLLVGTTGVGLAVGSLLAGSFLENRPLASVYGGSIGLVGLGLVVAAAAPNVWIAALCVVFVGVGNGIAVVCNALLIQRGAPDDARGRAFTVLMSPNYAVLGLGMITAGPLTDALGPRAIWALAGGLCGVAAVIGVVMARGVSARREPALQAPLVAGRRDWTHETLLAGVRSGDRRALARAITLVENADPWRTSSSATCIRRRATRTRSGSPGPPGVGKSSLISALVRHIRSLGQTVGVLSVDPSSPFTQGALLGDRIRLSDHFLDPGVFIRSMGTRGHLGGLAEATLQALLVLDAAGRDLVFIETVGTGQSEIEVISVADTTVLALMPGSGDSVQALKAGIMEIPDVIVVNKKDHPAAKTMLNEVRSILGLDKERDWRPPIVLTDALKEEGVEELWGKIAEHREYLESNGLLDERRRKNLAGEVFAVASARAKTHLERAVADDPELRRLLDEVQRRELDPLTAVREILAGFQGHSVRQCPDEDGNSSSDAG